MAPRIVDGPEITGQVTHKQTGQAYGPVTVTVSPKVYTDREMTASVTSLTTDGTGVFSCYAPPGTYTFTTSAVDSAPIESVEVLGREGGTGVSTAASLTTGINPTTHVFDALGYGVKADAVTRSDGAMTNGSAVLTSAGATFTSADVGKRVVVNNAKGAGTHLYGTISGFTNATTVTLSTGCTNNVSAMPFTYGTDDTTALQAAATAAAAANGVLLLPPTPCATTATITINGACEVRGVTMTPLFGLNTVTDATHGDLSAQTLPITAPFLAGSVLAVCAASVNGFTLNASGSAVHFRNVGVYFAGQFKTTGHGFSVTAAALGAPASGFNNGIQNSRWDNLAVFGHDGSHYAFDVLNTLELTGSLWSSFGGGGVQWTANSSISYYGACSVNHLHVALVDGPALGMNAVGSNGALISNIVTMDYACINAGIYVGTRYAAWGGAFGAGNSFGYTGAASQFHFLSADVETGTPVMPPTCVVSPDSYWPTISLNGDTAPFWMKYGKRRLNADVSVSLDTAEGAGSALWLLNDVPQGVTWGITTDGTAQMLRPGTVRHTGKSPSVSVGVALGTTPPPVVISGADSAGRAIFGSGSSPTTGAIGAFTFSKAVTLGAIVNLVPLNAATQALGLYISALTTTGFTVACAVAPAASQAVSTYAFSWTAEDATAAPVAPVVYDSFDKADSNTSVGSPQIGSAPTVGAGVWGISSNQAYVVSTAGDLEIAWDAGKTSYTITTKIISPTGPGVGLIVRYTDATHWASVVHGGNVVTNNGGSFTTLGNVGTFASGDTMGAIVTPTTIQITKNGANVGSAFTNSFNGTATKAGFYSANTQASTRWDNLNIA